MTKKVTILLTVLVAVGMLAMFTGGAAAQEADATVNQGDQTVAQTSEQSANVSDVCGCVDVTQENTQVGENTQIAEATANATDESVVEVGDVTVVALENVTVEQPEDLAGNATAAGA